MNLSIAKKMAGGFGLVIVVLVVVVVYNSIGVRKLRNLQDEGVRRAKDAVVAEEFTSMPVHMYQIVADAQINRNLVESLKAWEMISREYAGDLEEMRTLVDTDAEEEWLKSANAIYEKGIRDVFMKEMLPLLEKDDPSTNAAIMVFDGKIDESVDEFEGYVRKIAESLSKEMREADEVFNEIGSRMELLSMVLAIGGIVASILFAFFITLSITRPINNVIRNLSGGASQVSSASGQLSSSSQSLSQGASEQASSLEEISSSLEEMASMTKQNTKNTLQANSLSKETGTATKDSVEAMEKMSGAISEIKRSSDETAKIIKTIDEIAMQTNLLALNAAVEAARAGDAGRGFAVVAEEVRNLAQRSAEAAKNTAALIEESQRNSENGVVASEEVKNSLYSISEKVQKVNQLISDVSAASEEQSQGIDQISTAVAQMDKVTQGNAANAEESASASEELNGQAQNLNSMVSDLISVVNGSSTGFSTYSGYGNNHNLTGSLERVPHGAVSDRRMVGISVNKGGRITDNVSGSRNVPSLENLPLNDDTGLADF